ncbi:MAG: aminodeoxychorismate synthase component I [Bacteroidetes bacterium]|nr:aminodeoxychorismate synthase component I [Bacteroidota bacterium]
MSFLSKESAICKINDFAGKGLPFLFVVDFSLARSVVLSPDDAASEGIFFDIRGITNSGKTVLSRPESGFSFTLNPVSFDFYEKSFNRLMKRLKRGDTYLTNLTFPTEIRTGLSMEQIFYFSNAPFKLLFRDEFVVFSPEDFIRIRNHSIFSFPMKGTIDASLPDAAGKIMADDKESFEHNTIVDLIRNDLSMVSTGVRVNRFRYIDRVNTNRKDLLQISSEICGELAENYLSHLGEILFTLLPAGSVTGAPKEKTVEIIRECETYDRGFYTGIFGYFDGQTLDSAVMIRFIESAEGTMVFKSGGGITALSDARSEYEELIHKVYVPFV